MKFRIVENKKDLKRGTYVSRIGKYSNELIYYSTNKAFALKIPNPENTEYFWLPISQIKTIKSYKKKSHLFDDKIAIYHDITLYHDITFTEWYYEKYPWLRVE